mmetsp:Transcript_112772/g.318803  ORF Transcript_112772/g.318803 Transcript_112772/m.318803 type:complete len:287 (+) Transcript_112772:696-1556(+)
MPQLDSARLFMRFAVCAQCRNWRCCLSRSRIAPSSLDTDTLLLLHASEMHSSVASSSSFGHNNKAGLCGCRGQRGEASPSPPAATCSIVDTIVAKGTSATSSRTRAGDKTSTLYSRGLAERLALEDRGRGTGAATKLFGWRAGPAAEGTGPEASSGASTAFRAQFSAPLAPHNRGMPDGSSAQGVSGNTRTLRADGGVSGAVPQSPGAIPWASAAEVHVAFGKGSVASTRSGCGLRGVGGVAAAAQALLSAESFTSKPSRHKSSSEPESQEHGGASMQGDTCAWLC